MRALIVAMLALAAVAQIGAQTSAPPPDFSGTWVLDVSKSHTATNSTPINPNPAQGIREPVKVRDVPPKYPPDALSAKLAGAPILEGIIGRDGFIADLRVLKSVPRFDEAALDAVWQWEFTPVIYNGSPREVILTTLVTFSMGGGARSVAPTPIPVSPLKAFGTGLGLGRLPTAVSITQDTRKIVLTRDLGGQSHKVTYTPGQKPVTNKLKNYGSAKGDAYTYTSQWDNGRIVTEISWIGPQGLRTAKEVVSRTGDTLTIVTSRPDPTTGGDAFTQTLVYNRRQ